ncbi:LacI family DNA-binding transcriptional regulator [Tichowtungia aerotolerans]|uniref:Substrate-binding domain-containing protein n=1 Tax=Tichowtungia aerotolerans TaxID=2697043 RepID=A0A6P1MFL0_9BACT|nr:LacI family DNA-binding transcriptional regulator [Tichowtungia aerotolerans]QHI70798.1 substrate-binding domain-containing protein [Tichowtungia aerotolerans]
MNKKNKKRKLTIKDIAQQARVSITTASFVLNGQDEKYGIKAETAERVREAVRKNNFQPNYGARILKTGKSNTLAFIAPSITDGFYNEVVVSIETAALKAGYQLILCNSLDNIETEKTYLKNLIERKVDGIVLIPVDPTAKHLQILKDEQIKTVLFCPPELADKHFYCVDFDLASAPRLTVDHLVEQGCKKIVMLDWRPAKPRSSSWARNRNVLRKTFQASLRKHGLSCGTDAVWTLFGEEENPADAEEFKKLLSKQKPDAIVAMRDIQLLRAWLPLTEAGLSVPADIRLAGCDDIQASVYWSPPLTSILMPKKELGLHVVNVLLNESIQSGIHTFPVELVPRASSR